jgi:hypothetical protein
LGGVFPAGAIFFITYLEKHPKFLASIVNGKESLLLLAKIGWATFWANFINSSGLPAHYLGTYSKKTSG